MLSIDGVKIGDTLDFILNLSTWRSVGEELRGEVELHGWEILDDYYAKKIQNEGWSEADNLYAQDWQNAKGFLFDSSRLTVSNGTVASISGRVLEKDGTPLCKVGDSWKIPFQSLDLQIDAFCPDSSPLRCHFEGLELVVMFQQGIVQMFTLKALG